MRRIGLVCGAAVLLAGLGAIAAEDLTARTVVQPPAADRPPGYLAPSAVPATASVVTPPPPVGSWAESRDRAVFYATRSLQGTARWELATRDAVQTPPALTEDFSCALGLAVEPARAPRLTRLLDKTMSDAKSVTDKAKDTYGVQRPFVRYGGPICTENQRAALNTASYPSGHTTVSWAYALILAELFPDRAEAVFNRARVYGESRVVCGVHTPSDLEAGRVNGSVLVAALHANPEFLADLSAAKAEVAALRRSPPPLGGRQAACPVELEAAANRPW
jgi:acid phosphatase (class A)